MRKLFKVEFPIYRILPNTRASPNRCAPPPKFLDHVPEVSTGSSKIYMTTLFNDPFNAVITIFCCIP